MFSLSSATANRPIHCRPSHHCALCREELPTPIEGIEEAKPASQAWNYKILTICCQHEDGQPRVLSAFADFSCAESLSALTPLAALGKPAPTIELCFSKICRSYKIHTRAYCVHVQCWKLARSRLETIDNLNARVYQLARSSCSLFSIKENSNYGQEHERVTDFEILTRAHDLESSASKLLKFLSRFPNDIQLAISELSVESSLSGALAICKSSVLILGLPLSKFGTSTISVISPMKTLRTLWVDVYGHNYLSEIQTTDSEVESCDPNCVAIHNLRGIKFVLGTYGIRALQLLYTNKSSSKWLGGSPRGWIGTIYGDNITAIQLLRDDLKCIRIDLLHNGTIVALPEDPTLWDRDTSFSDMEISYLLEVDSRNSPERHPEWRLANRNPLLRGREYVSGITIYCGEHSITGIITHGEFDILTGVKEGCAVHLPLRHGEQIISFWVRQHNKSDHLFNTFLDCPSLMAVTNLGRTCVFAPEWSQDRIDFLKLVWRPISNDMRSPIISLFHDPLSVTRSNEIMSFGITKGEPGFTRKSGLRLPQLPSIPIVNPVNQPPMRYTSIANFVSVGNLNHVKNLKVLRRDERCLGLRIEHDDGLVEILGQWDASLKSHISNIYDIQQGPLNQICFCFDIRPLRNEYPENFVKEIIVACGTEKVVERTSTSEEKLFHVDDLDKPIAWWFNKYVDQIVFWTGTFEEVNYVRSKARKLKISKEELHFPIFFKLSPCGRSNHGNVRGVLGV